MAREIKKNGMSIRRAVFFFGKKHLSHICTQKEKLDFNLLITKRES